MDFHITQYRSGPSVHVFQLGRHRRLIVDRYNIEAHGRSHFHEIREGQTRLWMDPRVASAQPDGECTLAGIEDQCRRGCALAPGAKHVGGADIAADLLTISIDQEDATVMLVDIGTNTEVVVGNRHRMMAASCPAGPAFEGGLITYGMPGYEGAIEKVQLDDNRSTCHTIGNLEPQGICGSGLVDLLAELRRTRRMNELGVLADGEDKFIFSPEKKMFLSREDISNLAQAKSANYCGQKIVLQNYGVRMSQIKKLYLAGGFANYINVENAAKIGFIPPLSKDRILKVGNASLQGATIALLSNDMRKFMEKMVLNIENLFIVNLKKKVPKY